MNAEVFAPALAHPDPSDHLVVFSSDRAMLERSVGVFLGEGLLRAGAAVLIVGRDRRPAFLRAVTAHGVDAVAAEREGRLTFVDADAVLARFEGPESFTDDGLDALVDSLLRPHDGPSRPVRIYGEAVGTLVARGWVEAAVALEAAWERQAALRPHACLMCGYASAAFTGAKAKDHIARVRARHSRTLVV